MECKDHVNILQRPLWEQPRGGVDLRSLPNCLPCCVTRDTASTSPLTADLTGLLYQQRVLEGHCKEVSSFSFFLLLSVFQVAPASGSASRSAGPYCSLQCWPVLGSYGTHTPLVVGGLAAGKLSSTTLLPCPSSLAAFCGCYSCTQQSSFTPW